MGRATLLLVYALKGLPRWQDVALLIKQIYNVGYLSLVIIVLSAFSIGAVLALQFFTQLARFGAQEAVGVGLALVVFRELGPVVTARHYGTGSRTHRQVHHHLTPAVAMPALALQSLQAGSRLVPIRSF